LGGSLDEGRGTFFTDLLRNVDEPSWRLFSENAPRTNTDAGMLTNLRSRLPKLAKDADVFLINVVHLRKGEALLRPLIIHEICHYVEKIGHATNVPWHVNDEKNADTIIAGLDPPVRQLHSFTWARLLAYSGRFVVRNRLVVQGTVRQFLELALPDYDRPQWDGGRLSSLHDSARQSVIALCELMRVQPGRR
jgi:hypothetical protein